MNGAEITTEGDLLRIHFRRFGAEEYALFLKAKRIPESTTHFHEQDETYSITAPARFAAMLGVQGVQAQRQDLPLPDFLFDDQREIVRMALDAKRLACWSDCGLGKTLIQLEWARQVIHRTGGRVLIVTMNEIVPQTIEEAAKFYGDSLPILRLTSRQEMRDWCKDGPGSLAITNYEKWNPESIAEQVVTEARHLAGIVLDESSRLKTSGGKQKWALIKSCRGIEYKLSCTATPAPNDIMEFASQASFLEKMRSEGEIIWTYFIRDEKTHRWTVKPHARKPFFEFMSTWSIYVRDPRKYGWRLDMADVPLPVVKVQEIPITEEQQKALQELSTDPTGQRFLFTEVRTTTTIQRMKLSQVAKGFRYVQGSDGIARTIPERPATGSVRGKMPRWEPIRSRKPSVVADLIRQEATAGAQVLVWTVFDAEGEIIAEALKQWPVKFEALTGATKEKERLAILDRFRRGETRVLVSRARMLGYGMNLQFVSAMIFSGWDDSYESYYQAVRRAYRYGQTESLRVYIPTVVELERDMWNNICRKQAEHEAAIAEMEANYVAARGNWATAGNCPRKE